LEGFLYAYSACQQRKISRCWAAAWRDEADICAYSVAVTELCLKSTVLSGDKCGFFYYYVH
jgi:hypothetical protein